MRVPKPFYVKKRKTWYVQIDGKQHNLGKDKTEAMTQYRELMGNSAKVTAELVKPTAAVLDLLAEFLAWSERNNGERNFETLQYHISRFSKWLSDTGQGRLLVRDLKPFHVSKWLDDRYKNPVAGVTRAGAIQCLKRPFNWAVEEGYINVNPIARMKKPRYVPRGDEAYISDQQFAALIEAAQDTCKPYEAEPFVDYLTVLKDTGCRPQEIRAVEARHFDAENRVWRFPASESKGKRNARVVPLQTQRAFEICRRLALKHPEGPLFRNSDGNSWTAYAVSCRFQRLEKKCSVKACAYAFRHTFATNEILKGTDLITLKHMMGHTDLTMLGKVYEHIQAAKKVSDAAKAAQDAEAKAKVNTKRPRRRGSDAA